MARNIVKTEGFSLRQRKGKGLDRRVVAALIFLLCIATVLQATAQYIAYSFNYHAALGSHFMVKNFPVYPFYRAIFWLWELNVAYHGDRLEVASISATIFGLGLLFSAMATRVYLEKGVDKKLELLHGSAKWADREAIIASGLLDENGFPHEEGAVVGGWLYENRFGTEFLTLRHNGPEHILCFAPTRSGKGISLVLPTLLQGWFQSIFALDIKGELFALTAGFRKKVLGHKILKLDFTDPHALEKGTSATYNPLDAVKLDYDFPEDYDRDSGELCVLKRVGSEETAAVQNLMMMIVDQNGEGLKDHWAKTAHSFLVGCLTHLLYKAKMEGTIACVADIPAELSKPGEEWRDVVQSWQNFAHLGVEEHTDEDGNVTLRPLVHPVVAQSSQEMLNREDKEASSVLSTALSFLGLYRDPVIADNTRRSSFHIEDLMNHDVPVDLYFVVQQTDKERLRPLIRLFLTQIIRTLASKMEFKDGRSVASYKNRLLLMLDEFPTLGRMELFEEALAYIAGYGLKAYLITQDLAQLQKAYGREESIMSNCHLRLAFAPNKVETAEILSKMSGIKTIITENVSESTQGGGKLFSGKSRSTSIQQTQRPLLTVDECMQIRGLSKDGDKTLPGEMVIFPAGFAPIYGQQGPYFLDDEMVAHSKIEPPERSDNLTENQAA